MNPRDKPRAALLQVRDSTDPMRSHEISVFARALGQEPERLDVVDLLAEAPSPQRLAGADLVLIGGSGAYSACGEEPWLHDALGALADLAAAGKPVFASCWGFQALARALGGTVIPDPEHAELGMLELSLTAEGRSDPVFGTLPDPFVAVVGHEDHVTELPAQAVRLASSGLVANQGYRLAGHPVYATQFHPELDGSDLIARVRAYPAYVESITGLSLDAFIRRAGAAPSCARLIPRFVEVCV